MTVADKSIEQIIEEAAELGRKRIEERERKEWEEAQKEHAEDWKPYMALLSKVVPDWVMPYVSRPHEPPFEWGDRYGGYFYRAMSIKLPGCMEIFAWAIGDNTGVMTAIASFRPQGYYWRDDRLAREYDIKEGEHDFYVALAAAQAMTKGEFECEFIGDGE